MPTHAPPTADDVWEALRVVIDPEIGLSVVELGLVYGVEVRGAAVAVRLTMTSAACPLGDLIVEDALAAIRERCPGAHPVDVQLVWEPPWTPDRMSAHARQMFGG